MDELTPPRPSLPPGGSFERLDTAAPLPRQPATLPAGRGTAWWSEGWRLFARTPGIWIAITVLFVIIMVMIAFIPLLGTLATTLLAPVFAGGVLLGCRALDRGGELTIAHLFACFSDRLGPLIIVGVFYLIGTLVITVLVVGSLIAAVGMGSISALLTGDPIGAGYAMLASFGIGALFAVLFGLLLGIPLLMAYWFAPALVVFRNEEPMAAMKSSFKANLANMLPMLVYSLLGFVFTIVASIPFGLGWLVLAPVFAASVYASYKDIFGAPD